MSKLEELIKEYCPDGVEYKPLGEVCLFRRGTSLTSKDAKPGNIPAVSGGQKPAFYHNEYNRTGTTITVAGSGAYAGFVNIWYKPIFCCDAFTVEPADVKILDIKYLYHFLLNNQKKIYAKKTGAGIPHVHGKDLYKFQIPLPPLPVQQEIVRILDNFSQLTAELTAELAARKKQYSFYRDQLLTFAAEPAKRNDAQMSRIDKMIRELCPDGVEYKTLGEIATISRGGNFQKKDFLGSGFPCIHYGQIYTRYGLFAEHTFTYLSEKNAAKQKKASKNEIIMAVTSENIEDVCKCVAWLGEGEVAVSGHTAIIHHGQNPKYLTYYFQTQMFFDQKRKLAHGTKVIEVTPDKLLNVTIPIPPLSIQREIVSILDRFDALCNDLSCGLPAEIEARQKQYEYYRDKLLSFEIKN